MLRSIAENYRRLYNDNKVTKEGLSRVVSDKPSPLLTADEYEQITGEKYPSINEKEIK